MRGRESTVGLTLVSLTHQRNKTNYIDSSLKEDRTASQYTFIASKKHLQAATMSSTTQLGPLLRLWGFTTAQLPDATASPDDLAPFLISLLQEAVPFIDSAAPRDGSAAWRAWKAKGTKSYGASTAKVELLERVVPASELELVAARASRDDGRLGKHKSKAETWVCRRSVHADAAAPGTAAWAEFHDCFKDRHAETEEAFTPAVVAAREAQRWACDGVEVEEGGETWGRFTLRVEEMRHNVGPPLNDRVFPVLQMTCEAVGGSGEGKREFIVASVPVVDFETADTAFHAKDKGIVLARYVSVERIRKLPDADGGIEWVMATASDAAGVLPMWVQTLAVPGQIAKDVPLFLGWIAKERAGPAAPVPAADPKKGGDTKKGEEAKKVEEVQNGVDGKKGVEGAEDGAGDGAKAVEVTEETQAAPAVQSDPPAVQA